MAARFNAPVFLVGSALVEAKPRDVDIRIVLPDDAFRKRYGIEVSDPYRLGPNDGGPNVRAYWKDVAKLGAWVAARHSQNLNVDLQVQAATAANRSQHQGKPKARLDTLDVPADPYGS